MSFTSILPRSDTARREAAFAALEQVDRDATAEIDALQRELATAQEHLAHYRARVDEAFARVSGIEAKLYSAREAHSRRRQELEREIEALAPKAIDEFLEQLETLQQSLGNAKRFVQTDELTRTGGRRVVTNDDAVRHVVTCIVAAREMARDLKTARVENLQAALAEIARGIPTLEAAERELAPDYVRAIEARR